LLRQHLPERQSLTLPNSGAISLFLSQYRVGEVPPPPDQISDSAWKLPALTVHLIYGLWDDSEMPRSARDNVDAWKRLNPDAEVVVHGREESNALVASRFPWLQVGGFVIASYFVVLTFGNS
jgi:hypothetical protein